MLHCHGTAQSQLLGEQDNGSSYMYFDKWVHGYWLLLAQSHIISRW